VIIQSITILWNKKVRGAPYSTLRNRFSKSFSIPDKLINYIGSTTIPFQEILVIQNENGFNIKGNKVESLDSHLNDWKIASTEIQSKHGELHVYFKYSDSCGKPVRYDSRYHYLSEKAFILQSNEYGRITYNGRLVHNDTGEWIYQIMILNIYNGHSDDIEILTKKSPLKDYKQIEMLF
jgi:hypothetical protein